VYLLHAHRRICSDWTHEKYGAASCAVDASVIRSKDVSELCVMRHMQDVCQLRPAISEDILGVHSMRGTLTARPAQGQRSIRVLVLAIPVLLSQGQNHRP